MYSLKKQSQLGLIYFLLIALLGVILRLYYSIDISLDYRNIVHTHSHIALLGWVYTGLSVLIYHIFLKEVHIEKKYNRLFWFTQVTLIGMLLTFPFTGYALFSILFSSLFIIASYILARIVFKYTPQEKKESYAYKCIKIALWYMLISSIGPWSLGAIMNTLGSTSDLYRNAIYFYLHFQYNGWFILALFGVLFYFFDQNQIQIPQRNFRLFFWLLNIGVIATFGISLLWMQPPALLYFVSGMGALFQLLAFGIFFKALQPFKENIKQISSKLFYRILMLTSFFYWIKLCLQWLGTIPYFADLIATSTDFIIVYIHWIFLGVVSPIILIFLHKYNYIQLSRFGFNLYLLGFVLTEGFITYKGVSSWINLPLFEGYFESLSIASIILFLGILLWVIQQAKSSPQKPNH